LARKYSFFQFHRDLQSLLYIASKRVSECYDVYAQTLIYHDLPLQHETFDYPMKGATLVARRLFVLQKFASTELSKVLTRLGTLSQRKESENGPLQNAMKPTRTSFTKSSSLILPSSAAFSPSPKATSKNTTALPLPMASITAGTGPVVAIIGQQCRFDGGVKRKKGDQKDRRRRRKLL